MKVIPETYLMKVIVSVPDEGYTRNVHDEGYTRNASCALILIFTFLLYNVHNLPCTFLHKNMTYLPKLNI
jgi:hypothetical protein